MREAVVDANILILLVVGSVRPDLIGKHRRLSHFAPTDYLTVLELLRGVDKLVVTPNTLTETSNLLDFTGRQNAEQLADGLRRFVNECVELYVPSGVAMQRPEFVYLGLTDAGLLEQVSRERPLLTLDARLYDAAIRIDAEAAVNVAPLLANTP